jgi:hypothetical protein
MILDQDALVRLVHDQVETLLFKKEYEKIALKRDSQDKDAQPTMGMSTVEFLSHFRELQEMCHRWRPLEVPDAHIPALIVIPFQLVGVKQQLKKAEIGYAWGDDPEHGEVLDLLPKEIPSEPYLLVDVGIAEMGHHSNVVERFVTDRMARGGYGDQGIMPTLSEGIAFATHCAGMLTRPHLCELAGSIHRPPFDTELPAGPGNFSIEAMTAALAEELSPSSDEFKWRQRDRRVYLSRLNYGRLWLTFANYRSRIEAARATLCCGKRIDPRKYRPSD